MNILTKHQKRKFDAKSTVPSFSISGNRNSTSLFVYVIIGKYVRPMYFCTNLRLLQSVLFFLFSVLWNKDDKNDMSFALPVSYWISREKKTTKYSSRKEMHPYIVLLSVASTSEIIYFKISRDLLVYTGLRWYLFNYQYEKENWIRLERLSLAMWLEGNLLIWTMRMI